VNRFVKPLALQAASYSGALALKRNVTRSRFRIVTYHGVDDHTHPVVNFDRLQTDPATFARQVEKMATAFRIVNMEDAVRHFLANGTWPDRGLAITFDDGYRNNLEVAAPILKRIGVPATFFVTAGFVEGSTKPWWYELRQWMAGHVRSVPEAISRAAGTEVRLRPMNEVDRNRELSALGVHQGDVDCYPFMTEDECRSLIAMGFDIQCHSDTHVSFSGESDERVRIEIQKSVEFVKRLGCEPWGLAYPYGHEPTNAIFAHNEMSSCGMIAAFTTREGANGVHADRWNLRRWDMHGGYSALGAVARVS
jgi:peptidoglycan/xylan/chitin deacetylase (PgdA/CDA1 family)